MNNNLDNPFPNLKFALPISLNLWALLVLAILMLTGSGCASMSDAQRGTWEKVGAAVVVVGAVAVIEHHQNQHSAGSPLAHSGIGTPNCGATPSLCQ